MDAREIKELFGKFGASLDRDDVWQVQSAVVIKHKALERLAVAARISFDKPTVLRAERDEAVILVHGTMCAADNKNGGETRHEWSIGEALVNVNYKVSGKQAGYVYAMAEKRAKDRVILKLAGLHGLYSEDEADEFRESNSAPMPGRNAADDDALAKVTIFAAKKCVDVDELRGWWGEQIPQLKRKMSTDSFDKLKGLIAEIAEELAAPIAEVAE